MHLLNQEKGDCKYSTVHESIVRNSIADLTLPHSVLKTMGYMSISLIAEEHE